MKRTTIRILTPLISLIILVIVSCSDTVPKQNNVPKDSQQKSGQGVKGSPEEIARSLVMRYTQLIIDGYKNFNMTRLQEVATTELSQKAYYHMAAISEGNTRLMSNLKTIDFVKLESQKPGLIQIQTKEVWDYFYTDIKTGKRTQEVADYIYHVNYTIEFREGRWAITTIVANGDAASEKKIPAWNKMFGSNSSARLPH